MKKLLIAAAVTVLSSTTLLVATDAFAQASAPAASKTSKAKTAKKPVAKKAVARRPAPKRRLPIKRNAAKEAKVDPIPDGAVHWSCNDGLAFDLKGDMKRDQIVTVHWASKNYNLPRQDTTTGADRFHDMASGLDLVVIPTKAMLFSDHDDSRLADECKTTAMVQGAPAPTQSNFLLNRTGQ